MLKELTRENDQVTSEVEAEVSDAAITLETVEQDLRFHRHRHFDPASGHWISEDPLGFAGSDADLTRYPRSADASHARVE